MKNICLFVIILVCISCSSAPKRGAGEIDILRRQAETGIDLGNKTAAKGDYNNSLLLLTEAKRKAILADDFSLIIRSSLSLGNVLLSLDRTDDAFAQWDAAVSEAERIQNQELISACRIFHARGLLLSGRDTGANALEVIAREQVNIKDRYYTAFSWQTRGLALRALGSFAQAESALRQGLDIHLKDNYLEYASYDLYIIASVRSLSGNLEGAVQALEESMAIDRRIENSWGLAASWSAMGDVLSKMGRQEEAQAAHARSTAIKNAMNQ